MSEGEQQSTTTDPELKSVVFFNRKSLDTRKRKPKPIVYQIYVCADSAKISPNQEQGAWATLIAKLPQDSLGRSRQSTYMVYGTEEAESHVEIRLRGLLEALQWITKDSESEHWINIEATIISSDIFLINILSEWIPKWVGNDFTMSTSEEAKRPWSKLLSEIAHVSMAIKLATKWQPDQSHELQSVREKVDALMATLNSSV